MQRSAKVRHNGGPPVAVRADEPSSLQNDHILALSPLDKIRVRIVPVSSTVGVTLLELNDTIAYDFSFGDEAYHIVAGDELTVYFGADPKLELNLVVRLDGGITLPKVADLIVAGKTPAQLATEVDVAYRERMKQPASSVMVTKSNLMLDKLAGETVVQGDGTIALPRMGHINAAGLTPGQVEQLLGEVASKYYNNRLNATIALRRPTAEQRRGLTEFDQVVSIGTDGRITLPEIGYLDAAGKTAATLQNEIYETLRARYKTAPAVVITLEESARNVVYVDGEVGHPGAYPVTAAMSTLKALALAGGITDTGSLHKVILIRRDKDNNVFVYETDLQNFIKKGARQNDLMVFAQDIVLVPKTTVAKVDRWVDQYITRMLPFSRNVSYSYSQGEVSSQVLTPVP